jgi:hypothetical protein
MNLDITQLLTQLNSQIVEIHFTKADGTPRIMKATLQPHMLPERSNTTGNKTHTDQVIRVWDTEKAAWRSIRINSIQEVST